MNAYDHPLNASLVRLHAPRRRGLAGAGLYVGAGQLVTLPAVLDAALERKRRESQALVDFPFLSAARIPATAVDETGGLVVLRLDEPPPVGALAPRVLPFGRTEEGEPFGLGDHEGLLGTPLWVAAKGGVAGLLAGTACHGIGIPLPKRPTSGREGELLRLQRWLGAGAAPYALLVGPAGRGKSALLAAWTGLLLADGQVEVLYVPAFRQLGPRTGQQILGLMAGRLNQLQQGGGGPVRGVADPGAAIAWHLRQDRPPGTAPLLVLIDGLSEANGWAYGSDLRLPPTLGRGVKVLVSVRPGPGDPTGSEWLARLARHRVESLVLDPLEEAAIQDVLACAGPPLTALVGSTGAVAALHQMTGGEPVTVGRYLSVLRELGEEASLVRWERLGALRRELEQAGLWEQLDQPVVQPARSSARSHAQPEGPALDQPDRRRSQLAAVLTGPG